MVCSMPSRGEALLDRFYRPHHRALESGVESMLEAHGRCSIVDGHSFPSRPLPRDLDRTPHRPAICLGTDSFHIAAVICHAAAEFFAGEGLEAFFDAPYRGTILPQWWYLRDARVQSLIIER